MDTTKETEMTNETAGQAYARNLRLARELADRIADHLAELELGNDRLLAPDWGDVGPLAEQVKRIRSAADLMFSEGEDAPEKQ